MCRRRVLRRRGVPPVSGPRKGALRPGFALTAALWLTVAISAVALEFTLWARTRRLAAANLVEGAAARAAARAGLEHLESRLAARLIDYEPGGAPLGTLFDPWWGVDSLLAAPQPLGTARYRVEARDAASMLNLNVAPEAELTRFRGEADSIRMEAVGARAASALEALQNVPGLSHVGVVGTIRRDAGPTPGAPALERFVVGGHVVADSGTEARP